MTGNREFYNALEQKNFADFKDLLLYFSLLAAVYIAAAVYKIYLSQMLEMRLAVWLTRPIPRRLAGQAGLLSPRTRQPTAPTTPTSVLPTTCASLRWNAQPGPRSAHVGGDARLFVAILWSVSGPLSLAFAGSEFTIPGTWSGSRCIRTGGQCAHALHRRPLIDINFQKERREADFRFGMVRLRENAEAWRCTTARAQSNRICSHASN